MGRNHLLVREVAPVGKFFKLVIEGGVERGLGALGRREEEEACQGEGQLGPPVGGDVTLKLSVDSTWK